jgi:hypothetical protein
MRTIEVKVFKFSELSENAKQYAKDSYARFESYPHSDDAFDSIKALAKHFGGKVADYSIDWFAASYSSMDFSMPELTAKEIKARLAKLGTYNKRTGKGHGECKLTGYCMDESAIDGFRSAWRKGERDLDALMQAAYDQWLIDCQSDCESFYSDENFSEHCDINEYEFYENGEQA